MSAIPDLHLCTSPFVRCCFRSSRCSFPSSPPLFTPSPSLHLLWGFEAAIVGEKPRAASSSSSITLTKEREKDVQSWAEQANDGDGSSRGEQDRQDKKSAGIALVFLD